VSVSTYQDIPRPRGSRHYQSAYFLYIPFVTAITAVPTDRRLQ